MTDVTRSQREEMLGVLWLILAAVLWVGNAWMPFVWFAVCKGILDIVISIVFAAKDRKKP